MAFTVTSQPLYGQGGSYTAQMDRVFVKAVTAAGGVRKIPTATTGDLAVVAAGGAGTLNVLAGEVSIPGSSGQGHYFAVNDATLATPVFAANSSGNPRIDVVAVEVNDTGATPTVAVVIVQGTPAASPTVPALTVTATKTQVALANVSIPNGFTTSTVIGAGQVTDVRGKAFTTDLSVAATSQVASPSAGMMVYNTTTNQVNTYSGSAWQPLQAGVYMCTSTTRPTGAALYEGLVIYETDKDRTLRYNGTTFLGIDNPYVCTSTTRPVADATSALWDGQVIYETDTNEFLVAYNTATTAVWRRPWRQPWGVVAQANVTTSQTGISTTAVDLTGLSVTWTAVANRRYKATFVGTFLTVTGAANDTFVVAYTDATPTTVQQRTIVFPTTSFQQNGTLLTYVETGLTAGSITRKMRCSRFSGTGTATLNASSAETAQLIIEDIGPNGAPA